MKQALRIAALLVAALTLSAAAPQTDLATPFVSFWDRTANLPISERVALFRLDVAARFPAFYAADRFGGEAKFDGRIARAIEQFGPSRAAFAAKASAFNSELPRHIATFRTAFPDFQLDTPIIVLHSLGEMDGGTRDFDGKISYLIFGIDVMVAMHGNEDESPFFHHELFHTYHAASFADCPVVWCELWSEGLAVYVAKRLNPRATMSQLLLSEPSDMVPTTRAHLSEALGDLEASLDATDPATLGSLFAGGDEAGKLPRRRGYFLGLLVAEEIGRNYTLTELAHLTHEQAKPLIFAAVHRLRTQTVR